MPELDEITIAMSEYKRLRETQLHLEILQARGVDNWSGYCSVPSRDDYESDAEFDDAVEQACSVW